MNNLKIDKIKLIDEIKQNLIDKKEEISNEISEIATFISFYDENMELDILDRKAIDEKRYMMKAIYDVIEDLETLKTNYENMEEK